MRRFVPDVLRTEPQFRLLFASQVLSVVGDRVMLGGLAASALMPVGTIVVGPLAASVGERTALIGMSIAGVACALAFLAVPAVRRLPRGGVEAGGWPGPATR